MVRPNKLHDPPNKMLRKCGAFLFILDFDNLVERPSEIGNLQP